MPGEKESDRVKAAFKGKKEAQQADLAEFVTAITAARLLGLITFEAICVSDLAAGCFAISQLVAGLDST